MATFQPHNSPSGYSPQVLDDEYRLQVLAFLCDDVPLNLFQLSWMENNGLSNSERPGLYQYVGVFGPDGDLDAVSLLVSGSLLLIHASDPSAAACLGPWYREQGVILEHIVSGRRSVEPFWRSYAGCDYDPAVGARLNRHQELYVLERRRWLDEIAPELRPRFEPTGVRRSSTDELEPIYLASARMHLEETLEDPLQTQPEAFRRHVRHRIRSGRSFGWFEDRRLRFKADVSAISSFGAQISGVYTPPRFRGQGIATRAVFDICEDLFESGLPRITLYVNAENDAARRVYQKVGFQLHADYQTVFVEKASQH